MLGGKVTADGGGWPACVHHHLQLRCRCAALLRCCGPEANIYAAAEDHDVSAGMFVTAAVRKAEQRW